MKADPFPEPVVIRRERTETEGDIFRTQPEILQLVRGQSVTFQHESDLGGMIFVPHPEIFEVKEGENGYVRTFERTPEGFRLVLQVRGDAPQVVGEFDYAVFSHELQRFAVGNSPPRMILDD